MKIQTTFLLLLFSSFLVAQDILLFEDTKDETLVFSVQNTNGSSAAILRQILQTLASQHGHNPSFDLSYEYECRLIEKPNYLSSKLHFTNLEIKRDPRLQGFSFADLLLPPSVSLTVDLLAGDEVVHSVSQRISLLNLDQASIHFNYSDIQPSTVYTLVIKDLQFNYGNAELQAVKKRKDAIHQYRLAANDLHQIQTNIASLDGAHPDPDHIYTVENDVNEWDQQFKKIDDAPFWSILSLEIDGANDPEGLFDLRNEVGDELNNTRAWLKDLIDNIHELYYEKGVTLFENNQIGASKTAFNQSINAAKRYAPSHYFLAYIDFNDGQIDEAADRTVRILNDYNPDPLTRQNGEELARRIMAFHFDAGQHAVDAGHYPEGVDIYRRAQAFGQSIRGFHFGQEEAESRIREAYYLDFNHQIEEVIFLNRQGNHEQALINIEQALAFQSDFNIPSNFDTYSLHTDIVRAVFNDKLLHIKRLSENQSWDEAIEKIKDTENFLTSYQSFIQDNRQWLLLKSEVFTGKHQSLFQLANTSKINGQLDKALDEASKALAFATDKGLNERLIDDSNQQIIQIQKSRYQRFIFGGDKARQRQDFRAALSQFDAARALENRLSYLPVSIALDQKLKGTALQEIKRLFNIVMEQNRNNNREIANTFANIQNLSGRYHLTLEPEVKTIYQQLEEQQCANANSILLPALEQDLFNSQQKSDYPRAQEIIEEIKSLLLSYPGCGLNDQTIIEQAESVAVCAAYQETLTTAQTAEKNHRFRASLNHYIKAKELYQNPLVSSRLAGHPAFNTYDYIINHPSNDMVMAGANLYLDQREHDASLSLLKSLISRNIPIKRTEALQERLGSALAVRHYAASVSWKTALSEFVEKHERKSYKALKRSFRKRWKRMG